MVSLLAVDDGFVSESRMQGCSCLQLINRCAGISVQAARNEAGAGDALVGKKQTDPGVKSSRGG